MRFGIALQSNKTPAEYVAQAQSIEQYAFDVVSVYNDLFFQPAFGPLLLMAPHLRRAQLGPAALNPFCTHPVEIAGQIAVLDLVTQGRAYLGLARGSWLDQLGIVSRRPIQTLRECVRLIRHLLSKQAGGFAGEVFSLSPGHTLQYPVVRESVPITIGTWGPHTARLAGELADEVKIGGSANPSMAGYLRAFIVDGERAAGRAAGSVGVCLGAVTVVDLDRARARAAARRELAMYVPIVAPLDPTLRDAEWLRPITALAERGDFSAIAGLIPDAALDRLAFAGAPADLVRQVEDLARAGVTRVEFGTPHGLDPLEGIRLLGEQVLPSFRS
ncbi:MAG TPA: LLM class flavin-dependent oxidoreductase [Chloroflexota bacterium]|nr:LLM class flavin-dependent oxidoreductase [Chloroflexota bacterium]